MTDEAENQRASARVSQPANEHVSDLTWDRLHAGQLDDALADRARGHAAACASCEARRAQLAAAHERFASAPPPLRAAHPMRALRAAVATHRWRTVAPALVLALAAAVAIVLAWPRRGALGTTVAHGDHRAATRYKGGFAVTAFAGRDGDAVPLGAGDPIFPADRLQLSYSAERAGHLAVLSIDGAERASVYFPTDSATTWPAPAGHHITLPASTELDDVLGNERLWIVFCDRAQSLAPLVGLLTDGGVAAQPPEGCEVQRIGLTKQLRSAAERQ